jgi:hypothetical protein
MKLYNYFVLHTSMGATDSWRVMRTPIGDGWDSSNRQFWSRRRTWIGGGGTAGMYDSSAHKRAKTYKNAATASRAMTRIATNRAARWVSK